MGEELNIVVKEINGPSWGPSKTKIDIDELQKKIDQRKNLKLMVALHRKLKIK